MELFDELSDHYSKDERRLWYARGVALWTRIDPTPVFDPARILTIQFRQYPMAQDEEGNICVDKYGFAHLKYFVEKAELIPMPPPQLEHVSQRVIVYQGSERRSEGWRIMFVHGDLPITPLVHVEQADGSWRLQYGVEGIYRDAATSLASRRPFSVKTKRKLINRGLPEKDEIKEALALLPRIHAKESTADRTCLRIMTSTGTEFFAFESDPKFSVFYGLRQTPSDLEESITDQRSWGIFVVIETDGTPAIINGVNFDRIIATCVSEPGEINPIVTMILETRLK